MIEYKNMSLASQVFERLEKNILTGVYAPGEVISEKRLTAELGVSRTPIREALGRLMEDGLVSDSPSGTVVLGITPQDVDDTYEIKRRIEGYAGRMAAENMTDEQIKELRDILDQQEFYMGKEDAEKVGDLDTRFHDAIYENCGSRAFARILSPLHHKLMKYRRISLETDLDRMRSSLKEHEGIVKALSARDADAMEKAMLAHVDGAHDGMVRGISLKEAEAK